MRLQIIENLPAVMGLTDRIAQFAAKPLLRRGVVEKGLDVRRQAIEHLFQQIVADQSLPAMQDLGQGLVIGLRRQQPQAQPGNPAFAALDQGLQGFVAQRIAVLVEQRHGLARRQSQVLLVQFQQLPRQPQARQVPFRPLATGDQHQQSRRQVVKEELQTAVQHRALGQVIIVKHQQQGSMTGKMNRQLIEQAVQPLLEGERLMTLAHFQQTQCTTAQVHKALLQTIEQTLKEAPRITVTRAEPQPQALPLIRQALAELHCQ